MHWTRLGLLAGAAIVIIGTALPWLVGVPPGVLSIGDGTILGITTLHGGITLVAMALVVALALWAPRDVVPSRPRLGAAIGLGLLAIVVSSLVLGTSKSEIYDEIDRVAPTKEIADRAVVAIADKLRDFDMGVGAYAIAGGVAVIVLVALAGMFVRRVKA